MGAFAKENVAVDILMKEKVTKLVSDGESPAGFWVGTINIDTALGAIEGACDVLVAKINVV